MMAGKVRLLAAALLALTVVAAVNAGWRWLHNIPPYGPDLLGATATLRATTYDEARRLVENPPVADEGDQLMLGTVTWRPPPEPLNGGWYVIYVIDKRTDRMPVVFGFSSADEDRVSIGLDGVDVRVAEIYARDRSRRRADLRVGPARRDRLHRSRSAGLLGSAVTRLSI